jgi:hypothetical protein
VSELFIDLYLDEDVDVLLADLLRARGFAAMTTRDAGCRGASDLDQFSHAVGRQMVLFTHNRYHFELLAREFCENGRHHCGIVIAVRYPPYELLRRLLRILNHVTADEMRDQIRYI